MLLKLQHSPSTLAHEPKCFYELVVPRSWQRFREDVGGVLISGDPISGKNTGLDLITNEVMADVDVLGAAFPEPQRPEVHAVMSVWQDYQWGLTEK